VAGTFTVTTSAGVPASPITLTEIGDLPSGITFVDNGDGTATLSGTAPLSAGGTFPLTFTASNGVAPDSTQDFTLEIVVATALTLPGKAPASDGQLQGVPSSTKVGTTLHLSGSGYAAGAPVVIGIYSSPTVLTTATADSTGKFTADVEVPNKLGNHIFVAAAIGADGEARYLEARSVIKPAPAAALILSGSVLLAAMRRKRSN
jgi:hypothetical protein